MNQRAEYLIQILDKIGAPLLEAAHAGNDADTAQIVASLLGKVVEASIAMNQALDLNTSDAQDDSLRVALTALAGSLVANQYKQKGKLPEASDMTRMQSALSAVLTFGDNFTLSPSHIERLEKMKADGAPVDAHQINIQYVDALIPVINAVGAFSFGHPEQKLIMDISDRLVKRTAEMRETLLPGLSGDDEKLSELAILRATASLYAACHEAETQRLTRGDSESSAGSSLDPVWKAFEMRTAMLESVVKNIMPAGPLTQAAPAEPAQQAAPISSPPVIPAAPPTPTEIPAREASPPPIAPPIFEAPVQQETPITPATPVEVPPPQPAQPTQQGGASPMAFFKKQEDSPQEQAATPIAPAQLVSPPPIVPPAAPQEIPSAAPPPTSPIVQPAQKSDEENKGEEDKGGNPMSFFSKKE